MAILGKSAKLNIRQSAFVIKSLKLMSAKCTIPTIFVLTLNT